MKFPLFVNWADSRVQVKSKIRLLSSVLNIFIIVDFLSGKSFAQRMLIELPNWVLMLTYYLVNKTARNMCDSAPKTGE